MRCRVRQDDASRRRRVPTGGRRSGRGRGRKAWLAAGLLAALLALLPAGRAAAQEIESRYQLAVTQFYQVQHDRAGTPEEEAARWEAVAQSFQRIHRDAPAHARGADALYSAAIALRQAWLAGKATAQGPAEASAALAAFREFSTTYPNHALSDDSLMHQALLLEAQPGGTMAAVELYRKVARRRPPGSQAARARARLYALQREEPGAAPAAAPAPGGDQSDRSARTAATASPAGTRSAAGVAAPPQPVAPGAVTQNAVTRNVVTQNAVMPNAMAPNAGPLNAVPLNAVAANAAAPHAAVPNAAVPNLVGTNAAVPNAVVSTAIAPHTPGSNSPQPIPAARRGGSARLKRIQVLAALQFTRIILTTDRPVKPRIERVAGGPLRLDFRRLAPEADLAVPRTAAEGLVRRIAVTALDKHATRLELEVAPLERYELKTFELPLETKLVVDLYPQRPAAAARDSGKALAAVSRARGAGRAASAQSRSATSAPGSDAAAPVPAAPARGSAAVGPRGAPEPPGPNDAERLSLKASLGLKIRTLMIDPGHGGHDPGAMAFGLQEKDLALAIALRLRDLVARRHPDVRVGMTREEDRFIPLARRPKLAKAFGADLFVSIHLNASQVERFHGVETYFLNLTSDSSALEVAARENATSEKKVSDLNVILLDLLRDTNILESSKLAQALHTELVDTLKEANPVRDLGVKQAPFMVLIGAEMPSVLVEAGFVTNRLESERLKNANYLDRIADGIYAGLDKYMSGEDIVQARPRSRPATRLVSRLAP